MSRTVIIVADFLLGPSRSRVSHSQSSSRIQLDLKERNLNRMSLKITQDGTKPRSGAHSVIGGASVQGRSGATRPKHYGD